MKGREAQHGGNICILMADSQCYTAASHQLSILHMIVYMCQFQSPNSSHSLLYPMSTSLFSMSASLFLPCKQVHLYHFSRFHIYVLIYSICFSLSDLLHSVCLSLGSSTSLSTNDQISFLFQFSSVAQSCPTLCDPMNRNTPGLPVHHQLPESTQTHVR